MVNEMVFPIMFSGIRPGESAEVKDIISAAGLTTQDLDGKKLGHFIVAREGDTIVGTVGLEPAGDNALLNRFANGSGRANSIDGFDVMLVSAPDANSVREIDAQRGSEHIQLDIMSG